MGKVVQVHKQIKGNEGFANMQETFRQLDLQHQTFSDRLVRTVTAASILGGSPLTQYCEHSPEAATAEYCRILTERYNTKALLELKEELEQSIPDLEQQIHYVEQETAATFRKLLLAANTETTRKILLDSVSADLSTANLFENISPHTLAAAWDKVGAEFIEAVKSDLSSAKFTERQRVQIQAFSEKASSTVFQLMEAVIKKGEQLSETEIDSITDRAPVLWYRNFPSEIVLSGILEDQSLIAPIQETLKSAYKQRKEFLEHITAHFDTSLSTLEGLSVLPSNTELRERAEILEKLAVTAIEIQRSGLSAHDLLLTVSLEDLPAILFGCKELARTKKLYISPTGAALPTHLSASQDEIDFTIERIIAAQPYKQTNLLPPEFISACQKWAKEQARGISSMQLRYRLPVVELKKLMDVFMFGIYRMHTFETDYIAGDLYEFLSSRHIINESEGSFLQFLDKLDEWDFILHTFGKISKDSHIQLYRAPWWKKIFDTSVLTDSLESMATKANFAGKICSLSDLKSDSLTLRSVLERYIHFFSPLSEAETPLLDKEVTSYLNQQPLNRWMLFRGSDQQAEMFHRPIGDLANGIYTITTGAIDPSPSWMVYSDIKDRQQKLFKAFAAIPQLELLEDVWNWKDDVSLNRNFFWKRVQLLKQLLSPHESLLEEINAQNALILQELDLIKEELYE